jgi:hypothetical protein
MDAKTPAHEPLEPSLHLLFALAKSWEISADQMLRSGRNDPITNSSVSQLRECAKQLRQRATWVREQFEIAELIQGISDRIDRDESLNRQQFARWIENEKQNGWGQLLESLRVVARMGTLPDFTLVEPDYTEF